MPILSNPRHEKFCQELAKGKSASEAYEAAGFKPNRHNGAALARQQHISARVAEILTEREAIEQEATQMAAEALAIDKQWVMARLVENVERAMQATPVRDTKGQPTGEYKYEGSVANKALELLGKEFGMFIDRKQIDVDGELRGFTDAQLIALLAGEGEEGDSEEGSPTFPN